MQSNNRKGEKMYAHIFKARQKGWYSLEITRDAGLRTVVTSTLYPTKAAAKAAAKALGATPHNY